MLLTIIGVKYIVGSMNKKEQTMPKMIITRGFPASGKTTWANEWVAQDPENRVNVNRDDIRKLNGFPPIGDNNQEASVTAIADMIMDNCISYNKDIVVSDTNLRVSSIKRLIRFAHDNGYEVEIKNFKVGLKELISRDSERYDSVGEDVIRTLWQKFPYKNWMDIDEIIESMKPRKDEKVYPPYNNDPRLEDAIIVDIDGTLAHHEGVREPYDFSLVSLDKPDEVVIYASNTFYNKGVKVIVVSGRSDICLEDTKKWLNDSGVYFHELHMRKDGDVRADWIIKDEIIRNNIQDNFHVLFCLDDRNQVVNHNRKMGYKVFQVEPGDF